MSRRKFQVSIRQFLSLSVGIGILFSSSIAFAQTNGDVVVPIDGDNTTTPDTSDNGSLPTQGIARFSCQVTNGNYTVMYQPESQPDQFYPWATPKALGGGWTPEKRCNEIARRLESYRPEGLQELRTARENNLNTVCVTTDENAACRIVFTVPPGQDANVTRNQVFENLLTADSGQGTLPVYTFTGGGMLNSGGGAGSLVNDVRSLFGGSRPRVSTSKKPINLKPFLDKKDGGTGTRLRRTPTKRPATNRPLNIR